MKVEKELLESKGFPEWDRRDFQRFIQGLEMYATNDYVNISRHMEGSKTPLQVQQYAQVFFSKIDSLNDALKIKAKINKA
jgi:SWI/SNF-related matrix-associated actin-dependent regulator of chromatin subfamily A member 5